MGATKKGILVLDPRTKILLLLGINIYVFTNSYVVAEMIVMAALVVLLLLCGVYKTALKSTITYIVLLAIKYLAFTADGNYPFGNHCPLFSDFTRGTASH